MPDKPESKSPTNAEFSDWLKEVDADDRELEAKSSLQADSQPSPDGDQEDWRFFRALKASENLCAVGSHGVAPAIGT
jgi:hypothetical protein